MSDTPPPFGDDDNEASAADTRTDGRATESVTPDPDDQPGAVGDTAGLSPAEAISTVGGPEAPQAAAADANGTIGAGDDDPSLDVDDDEEEGEIEPVESPYDRPGAWYVVHTYSGYENKVKTNMASMVASLNMEDKVYEVVIPMEDVIDFKNGKRVVVQKKMFPGYLLVRADMDENVWFHIRNTPGVTGFVGSGAKPMPLSRRDVETFLAVKDEAAGDAAPKKHRPQTLFSVSETVRVKEGAFADFTGTISDINEDQLKLKVLVNIFGRETPVELGFDQVAKL